jgi:hypothetical protein
VREDRSCRAADAAAAVGDAHRESVDLAERLVGAETSLRQHAFQAQSSPPRGEDFEDGGHDDIVVTIDGEAVLDVGPIRLKLCFRVKKPPG